MKLYLYGWKWGKQGVQWNTFAMTSSSQINFDSSTLPRFKYQPWSFLCEVYTFSTSSCAFSTGRLFSTRSPPTCKPGGRQIMCECDALCASPPRRGLMICPGRSPVQDRPARLLQVYAACFAASWFSVCDSGWTLHRSIWSVGVFWSFVLTGLSDLFIRCFTCHRTSWEVRCEDAIVLID